MGGSLTVSNPPAMPESIWPSAIFMATEIAASSPVPQARCMSMPGVCRIEAGRQHALAHQVEVLGVLEHGAAGDIAQALAREAVFGDQRLQYRGVHVLVADARIGAVAARERNAHAADHGDSDERWIRPAWATP